MLEPATKPNGTVVSVSVCLQAETDVMILAQAPQLAGMQDLGHTAAAFIAGNSTELAHYVSY